MGATGRDLHFDVALSNMMLDYRPMGMIADQVFPIVPVQKQSDNYLIWSQADAFRVEDDKRAPATEANIITRDVSSGQYFCENYALKERLTLEDRENMDDAFIAKARTGKAQYIVDKLMLNMEKRVANIVNSTSNVGTSSAVASAWTTYTNGNSDPLGDVWTMIDNVQDITGYRPNRILMGDSAWRNFRRHADVISMLYGNDGNPTQSRLATEEQMKAIFELDWFGVTRAYENTNQEGQAGSYSQILGATALVYYAPMNPSMDAPSYGYSPRWQKAGIPNLTIENLGFDNKIKAEEIEGEYYQDEIVTSSVLGATLTSVNG